jgi:hypothetical protein
VRRETLAIPLGIADGSHWEPVSAGPFIVGAASSTTGRVLGWEFSHLL